ncbi:MAG: hypothetical protein ACOYY2_02910 [Actinomycetota bacterium]
MAVGDKLVALSVEETSGVDHPAHLHEGWLVIKAADPQATRSALDALVATKGTDMPEQTPEQRIEALQAEIATLKAERDDLAAQIAANAADKAAAEDPDAALDALVKSAPEPVRKALEAAREAQRAAEEQARVAKAAEEQAVAKAADEAAVAKAKEDWAHVQIDVAKAAPALRRLAETSPDLHAEVVKALNAAEAASKAEALFKETGRRSAPEGETALARLDALAKAAHEQDATKSVSQHFAEIAQANPDLYAQYLQERGA